MGYLYILYSQKVNFNFHPFKTITIPEWNYCKMVSNVMQDFYKINNVSRHSLIKINISLNSRNSKRYAIIIFILRKDLIR